MVYTGYLVNDSMLVSRALVYGIAGMMIGGCASIPENIRTPVAGPDIRAVRADPGAHLGERVRWGGTISDIRNLETRTVITVVARPITRKGEPHAGRPAIGRYLAEVDGFLDPEEYEPGRRITVVGRVTEIRPSKIDEHVYDYPVVRVQHLHLWEAYVRRDRYPYYRWPYYDPFWRYPYWWNRHHIHGFGHYPWWY